MRKKESSKMEVGLENGGGRGRGRGRERGRGSGSVNGTLGITIEDPRFSRLHIDPRFQRLPHNKAKVTIDPRFAHMFTEEGFSNTSANKRGIQSKGFCQVDPLRRYYRFDEEGERVDKDESGEGNDQNDKLTTKKKRGKKSCVVKKQKGAITTVGEEIAESDEPPEEFGTCAVNTDATTVSKKQKRKKYLMLKRGVGANPQSAETEVHTGDSDDEVEKVDELGGDPILRGRAGAGSAGSTESNEELADDEDESESEERRQEDEDGGEKEEERENEQEGEKGGEKEEEEEKEEEKEEENKEENEEEKEEGEKEDEGGRKEEGSSSSASVDSESDIEQGNSGAEEDEKIPITNEETRRLAIVNMDWEHIGAVHLLVLMRSFAPKGGSVLSVTVYPSEFGIEQMKEENVHGPKSILRQIYVEDESDEELAEPEKLRQYEKAKLRYYYAKVDCDSASTAAHLYKSCDGLEFERTSNTLDLRYIPEAMEFKREPRDSASEVPVDYKPIDFETRALQQSNVKLTWDDDEPIRVKALRRNFNRDMLNEMDFRAYVAPSSGSESEDEAAKDGTGINGDEGIEPSVAEERKEKVRSKYVSLLAETEEADMVCGKKADKGNIEIRFDTGLDELSEKLLAKTKKDKADETVWEAYLRRKEKRKNAQKDKKAATNSDISSDDEGKHSDGLSSQKDHPFFSYGDVNPFADRFFNQDMVVDLPAEITNDREGREGHGKDHNKSKKEDERKRKKDEAAREKKESENKQAELELLLYSEHMVLNGEEAPLASSVHDLVKKQSPDKKKKKKKRRKTKGEKRKMEEVLEKTASTAIYDDPRFASLFTSHLFALDPTDPQFTKTGSRVAEMQRQHFKSQDRRLENSINEDEHSGNEKGDESSLVHVRRQDRHLESRSNRNEENGGNQKRKAEMSYLVRSLKLKCKRRRLEMVLGDLES